MHKQMHVSSTCLNWSTYRYEADCGLILKAAVPGSGQRHQTEKVLWVRAVGRSSDTVGWQLGFHVARFIQRIWINTRLTRKCLLGWLLEIYPNAKVGGHVPLIHSIHLHAYILQKSYSFWSKRSYAMTRFLSWYTGLQRFRAIFDTLSSLNILGSEYVRHQHDASSFSENAFLSVRHRAKAKYRALPCIRELGQRHCPGWKSPWIQSSTRLGASMRVSREIYAAK